jgi:hypothetical protein
MEEELLHQELNPRNNEKEAQRFLLSQMEGQDIEG